MSRGGGGRALAALMLRSDAKRRVSKQVPAGRDGRKLRVRRNPGRGINLFKGLRRIFRAIVGRRGGGRTLTALMLRSDAKRRVSKQVPAGRDGRQLRVRRNPGRGINLFKGLRRIFRVIVSRRRLSPDLVKGGRAGPGSRRIRAADGFGGHRNAGRGFNLFKGLQQNFRAIVGRRDGGRALAALMLRSDAKRRVSKQVPAGRDGRRLRVRRKPGRGINLFKGLRRIFRVIVSRRRLSPDLVKGGRAGPGSRRIRAADGFGGHRNAGRGFNLFKGLQQNFRAIVGRRDGGRALAALMLRSDAKRRVSKQVRAGRDGRRLRVRRKPGRGINLFKGLRRIFRATVTPNQWLRREGLG